MTSRVLPDSIQIIFPEGWTDIPLDGRGRERLLASLRSDHPTTPRSTFRQLEMVLAQISQLATDHQVLLASGVLALLDDDGPSEERQLVVLNGVASAVGRQQLGTDVPLVADVLIKTFSGRTREGEIQFDEIEPPSKIELAGTTAVKLVRLMRAPGAQGDALKQFTQSYLVPVASGDGLIVLQFSTINLEFARDFSQLFEKIAKTLRILYPDDPTFLDDEATQPA